MRKIKIFFQVLFIVIWSILTITTSLLVLLFTFDQKKALGFLPGKAWAPGILWGVGGKLQVKGAEKVDFSKPHIFASNHQSHLDIACIFNALPIALFFIAKKELKKVPVLGWYMAAVGMIFIDRGDRRRAALSLRQAGKKIRNGKSIITFPEGTRSKDGKMGPFKKGSFILAIKSGVPIIPIGIEGTGKVWPPGSFRFKKGAITLKIGNPIPTESLGMDDVEALRDKVRSAITVLKENESQLQER